MKVMIGILLLIGALVLSYVSSSNGEAMMAKKDALVTKYVDISNQALEDDAIDVAIKNAKMAIQADPNSKKGFTAYKKALEAKYKPTDAEIAIPEQSSPAEEDDYNEDDLGC